MGATQALSAVEQKIVLRSVVLASPDAGLRQRLGQQLRELRWTVLEANGGAEAMSHVDASRPEALLVDSWLPDLEVGEFAGHLGMLYPGLDVLRLDGVSARANAARSPRRNELLHAIREAQEFVPGDREPTPPTPARSAPAVGHAPTMGAVELFSNSTFSLRPTAPSVPLPELVGDSAPMEELKELIRLVAPRSATVLIEGETGTGKEVVAKAIHRLSARAGKPFVVLNCAAIPEALLEAELFGHTRGAFTGAVQSRTGRIEAADGGTLFLDEIGEMPLALQAKMLRFLECGELQRVGENEPVRVNVRVIAATHQPLEQRAEEKTFRLDLYHRLAVFPLEVPALREHMQDLPGLVNFFLDAMGREAPRKRISAAAIGALAEYAWPGNVRELMHVLERGTILAGDRPEIGVDEIRLKTRRRQ